MTTLYYKSDYNQIESHSNPGFLQVQLLAVSYNGSQDDRLYMITSEVYTETVIKNKLVWSDYPGSWIDMIEAQVLGETLQPDREIDDLVEGIIDFHFELPHKPTLGDFKTEKKRLIDVRSSTLIVAGFNYNGSEFSLSLESQANWTSLYAKENAGKFSPADYPIAVPTKDDSIYYIQDAADLQAGYQAGLDVKYGYVSSGLVLKTQVDSAGNISEINAVQDLRT